MIRKLCALGAAVLSRPCAVGLICGPIPLFMGTVLVPGLIRFFSDSKKEKIIKSDKFPLKEKIDFGISDTKLKIIIDKIDSDVVNDSEKMKLIRFYNFFFFTVREKSNQPRHQNCSHKQRNWSTN